MLDFYKIFLTGDDDEAYPSQAQQPNSPRVQ